MTKEAPAGLSGPGIATGPPPVSSVQTRLVAPTASSTSTSIVTPATRSFDAMLNQPPMLASAVVIETVGSVVSRTRTTKESESERPPESVTVQLTVVSPRAKSDPEAGTQLGV